MKKLLVIGVLALGLVALIAPRAMACDGTCDKPETINPAPAPAPAPDESE